MKALPLILSVSFMLAGAARADVAVYEGLMTFQRQGNSEKKTFPGKLVFVVDLDTYVGSFLYAFPKQKCYQTGDVNFRHGMFLIGAGAKTSTALQAVNDTPGLGDIFSYTATGKNSQLTVSDVRIATAPRVYKFNYTEVFYGGPSLLQVGGLPVFNAKKTLAANALGQSPSDVIVTLAAELFNKGFSAQYP